MNWLRKLFGLCQHKWTVLDSGPVYDGDEKTDGKLPWGTKYILQCECCGDVKSRIV